MYKHLFMAFEQICKTPTGNLNRCTNIKSYKLRSITEIPS